MGISGYEFYHGAALLQLLQFLGSPVQCEVISEMPRGCYVLNGDTALYIKHSSKRMTPWVFTFHEEHQATLRELQRRFARCFIILVCHSDGVVVLDAAKAQRLLGDSNSAWIRADRRMREMYEISGSGGELPRKVADCDFRDLHLVAQCL